jgi:hypothetical protein
MIIKFGVENPFGERLFQFVEKPVLGKHILGIAPRKKLVQCVLLDRPPAGILGSVGIHREFTTAAVR